MQAGDQRGRRVGLEEQADDGVVVEERITDGSVAGPWCSLPCRSIRIGNYKVRNEVPRNLTFLTMLSLAQPRCCQKKN